MAVFKCNISGNTMEVFTVLDIKSMEVHPGYTLVEDKPVEEVEEVKKKPASLIKPILKKEEKEVKKKNQEL